MCVSLKETDTFWHFDIPSTWVAADDDDKDVVKARNDIYQEVGYCYLKATIFDGYKF